MRDFEVVFTEYGTVGANRICQQSFDIKIEVSNDAYGLLDAENKEKFIKEFVSNFHNAYKLQREALQLYMGQDKKTHYIFMRFGGLEERMLVNLGSRNTIELQSNCDTMKEFSCGTERQCFNKAGKIMGEILRVYFENGSTDFSGI